MTSVRPVAEAAPAEAKDRPPEKDEVVLSWEIPLADVLLEVDRAVELDGDLQGRVREVNLGDEAIAVEHLVVERRAPEARTLA